jgi:hypothetical protein
MTDQSHCFEPTVGQYIMVEYMVVEVHSFHVRMGKKKSQSPVISERPSL